MKFILSKFVQFCFFLHQEAETQHPQEKITEEFEVLFFCVVVSNHRIGGEKNTAKIQFYFFSELGNFNVGGPVNQVIKKTA